MPGLNSLNLESKFRTWMPNVPTSVISTSALPAIPKVVKRKSSNLGMSLKAMEGKMKLFTKVAIVLTVFNVASVFGQSRREIETKFGQPWSVYVVAENIWMSPEYASDGQVCRMTFYPRRVSSTTHYFMNQLPFDEFRSIIDVIVPAATRGAQKEPFGNGLWIFGGGVRRTTFLFEHLAISYAAGFRINPDLGKGELINLFDYEVTAGPEKPKRTKEDFSLYSDSTAEIVTVQWLQRKCNGESSH